MKVAKRLDAYVTLSFILLVGTGITVLGLFFSKFHHGFSGNHADWGDFGSYVSGTVGVMAACLAVIWLIRSVHIQKIELQHHKKELTASGFEQKKQTYISALTAMISSGQKIIEGYEGAVLAINNGNHIHPFADEGDLHILINQEWKKVEFYQRQIEQYLPRVYVEGENEEDW